MHYFVIFLVFLMAGNAAYSQNDKAYELVWFDDFNEEGEPDRTNWKYERGFRRNQEAQWYQHENAFCKDGFLVIEAREEKKINPDFTRYDDKNWRKNRDSIKITSSSLNTKGKQSWRYGRFLIRAKIPIQLGVWPAFWSLGSEGTWPENGEIDIMEFYRGMLLANVAWGSETEGTPIWRTTEHYINGFDDEDWADKFHIWRMDWDTNAIRLYVDDQLLNEVLLSDTVNAAGSEANPFTKPHYLLINLAIGGMQGGDPTYIKWPVKYIIDYVKVYQEKER